MKSEVWNAQYGHSQPIPERTTSRHWWARIVEGTDHDDDQVSHPYTNWGFTNRLDFELARLRETRR